MRGLADRSRLPVTGEVESGLRHLRFGAVGSAGNQRDTPPIQLARFKVHLLEDLCGILAEKAIEDEERLNERRPVRIADATASF